jgi:hypothetical protein
MTTTPPASTAAGRALDACTLICTNFSLLPIALFVAKLYPGKPSKNPRILPPFALIQTATSEKSPSNQVICRIIDSLREHCLAITDLICENTASIAWRLLGKTDDRKPDLLFGTSIAT